MAYDNAKPASQPTSQSYFQRNDQITRDFVAFLPHSTSTMPWMRCLCVSCMRHLLLTLLDSMLTRPIQHTLVEWGTVKVLRQHMIAMSMRNIQYCTFHCSNLPFVLVYLICAFAGLLFVPYKTRDVKWAILRCIGSKWAYFDGFCDRFNAAPPLPSPLFPSMTLLSMKIFDSMNINGMQIWFVVSDSQALPLFSSVISKTKRFSI